MDQILPGGPAEEAGLRGTSGTRLINGLEVPTGRDMMSSSKILEYWSVWYPKAASTGILLARGLIEPAEVLLVHAVPPVITVEITDAQGSRLAIGKDLPATQESPICRLRRSGEVVNREDIWPKEDDLGHVVLLPGGEAGILKSWWHAEDHQEWRWQVEFYNTIRG